MNIQSAYLGSSAHLVYYYLFSLKEIAYCLSQFASEIYIDREGQREKRMWGYLYNKEKKKNTEKKRENKSL